MKSRYEKDMKNRKDGTMRIRVLNRDMIKYLAMFTMLLNHIANIFLEPGTVLFAALVDIGYFTAPVMCWFLVEGYHYTHSKKMYAIRLAVFALLSEVPFCLAFSEAYTGERIISFCGFNMIFTLFLCFCILLIREKVPDFSVKVLLYICLFFISAFSDWALLAPAFTLLFAWGRGDMGRTKKAFAAAAGLFVLCDFAFGDSLYSTVYNLACAVASALGVAAAGFVIIYMYNGQRIRKGEKFSKWFFYLFYPIHLLILGIIRLIL